LITYLERAKKYEYIYRVQNGIVSLSG